MLSTPPDARAFAVVVPSRPLPVAAVAHGTPPSSVLAPGVPCCPLRNRLVLRVWQDGGSASRETEIWPGTRLGGGLVQRMARTFSQGMVRQSDVCCTAVGQGGRGTRSVGVEGQCLCDSTTQNCGAREHPHSHSQSHFHFRPSFKVEHPQLR